MKQQITLPQWQELTLKQQRAFQEPLGHGGLPTIGDMIEFLGDHWYDNLFTWDYGEVNGTDNEILCDALWRAAKEKLERS